MCLGMGESEDAMASDCRDRGPIPNAGADSLDSPPFCATVLCHPLAAPSMSGEGQDAEFRICGGLVHPLGPSAERENRVAPGAAVIYESTLHACAPIGIPAGIGNAHLLWSGCKDLGLLSPVSSPEWQPMTQIQSRGWLEVGGVREEREKTFSPGESRDHVRDRHCDGSGYALFRSLRFAEFSSLSEIGISLTVREVVALNATEAATR